MRVNLRFAYAVFLLALPVPFRPGAALEQSWEEPGVKGEMTPEQVEQVILDLGAETFGVRDSAARKLLAGDDTRVLVRLMEEQAAAQDPEVRARAGQLLPELKKKGKDNPLIKDFHILGPFPLTDEERARLDQPNENDCLYIPTGLDELRTVDLNAEVPLRPKQAKNDAKLKWRRPYAGQYGTLDLCAACKDQREFAHVFLLTFIYSAKPKAATLSFGSDDGIAIWLNGKCVFYGDYHRPLTPDSDQLTVDLQKGWNPVMLRIAQGYGEWSVALRVSDARGRPWPAKFIDPQCGGEPRPAIPAPKQPDEQEKAKLTPERLRSAPAGENAPAGGQNAAVRIQVGAPVQVQVQVLQAK